MKLIVIPQWYEVTRDARVISHLGRPRELRQYLNGSGVQGYPAVWLYLGPPIEGRRQRKHYAVYRLVAHVHLPPRPNGNYFVCHKDGDHLHSHADNLYWGTASENTFDSYRHRRERAQYGLYLDAQQSGALDGDVPY